MIKAKYKIKNTVGYSLNALVDYDPSDPINIIQHLMVGSEGTLGFISNVTYNCVRELPHKVRGGGRKGARKGGGGRMRRGPRGESAGGGGGM